MPPKTFIEPDMQAALERVLIKPDDYTNVAKDCNCCHETVYQVKRGVKNLDGDLGKKVYRALVIKARQRQEEISRLRFIPQQTTLLMSPQPG